MAITILGFIALTALVCFFLVISYITIRGAYRIFFGKKKCWHIRGKEGRCRVCGEAIDASTADHF